MARIRTIKPEFPQSESMGRVSRDARLCFIELWTIADDSGRLRGAPRMLASLLFPYDDDAGGLISGWLEELEREECLIQYQSEGQHYIQITNWFSHQKIDKRTASKIPSPPNPRESSPNPREEMAEPADYSSEDQGPRTKDQGMDQGPKEGKPRDFFEEPKYEHPIETPRLDGARRIEAARSTWNNLAPAIGPACRLLAITFKADDTSDCLRTMSAYSDSEIAEALRNYAEIRQSTDHEIKSPYQSFVGFIRGGVEKFVTEADPWSAYKRRLSFSEQQDEDTRQAMIAAGLDPAGSDYER